MSDRPRQDVKLSGGNGSVGRVFALQAKGRRFDSGFLHKLERKFFSWAPMQFGAEEA